MSLPGTYPGARVVSPDQIRKMYAVKMSNAGAVQFSAAPTATVSTTSAGTVTKNASGFYKRNYIKGVVDVKNTNATKKATATAWLITPGGSTKLGSAAGTPSATKAFTMGPLAVVPPYSIKIKGAVTTAALSYAKVKSLSINDLTTIYAV